MSDTPPAKPKPLKFIFIEQGYEVETEYFIENELLVQLDDGTYRRPTGEELAELHRRHPRFVRKLRKADAGGEGR